MFFRNLALTGLTLAGTIAPIATLSSIAAPTPETNAPILLADGHSERTITVVVDEGTSVPAERVEAKYNFRSSYFGNDIVPLEVAPIEAVVRPVLERAGIPTSAVEIYKVPNGDYGYHEIAVTIALPASHTAIGNANDAMGEASNLVSDATLSMDGVRLGVSSCDALETTARREMLSAAEARATILADEMGVTLGELVSVHDSYQSMRPFGAAHCLESSGELPPTTLENFYGAWTAYSPTASLEVTLSAALEATFLTE
ncbi:MAG: SIMPL domain-containing protein [Geitlerinemataceae cyanobacterium]